MPNIAGFDPNLNNDPASLKARRDQASGIAVIEGNQGAAEPLSSQAEVVNAAETPGTAVNPLTASSGKGSEGTFVNPLTASSGKGSEPTLGGTVNPLTASSGKGTESASTVTLRPDQIQGRNALIAKLGRELTPAEEIAIRNAPDAAAIQRMMEGGGVDVTGQQTAFQEGQDALNRVNQTVTEGDVDNMLATSFSDLESLFAGVDLSSLTQDNFDYIRQLMTGQTDATRALQAKEAAAMAQGVQNLMNNIGATAANAGITGGALSNFYAQGLQKVGDMLGDFALDNIIRMADTQQQGFSNFMQAIKLPQELQSQWMDTFTKWENYKTGNSEADRAFGWNAYKYIMEAAATDPALGVIAQKALTAIQNGTPIEEALTPEEIQNLQAGVDDQRTMSDIAAEQEYWNTLGIATTIEPINDADGNQKTNSSGELLWQVKPKTVLGEGGSLEFVRRETDGDPPLPSPLPVTPENYSAYKSSTGEFSPSDLDTVVQYADAGAAGAVEDAGEIFANNLDVYGGERYNTLPQSVRDYLLKTYDFNPLQDRFTPYSVEKVQNGVPSINGIDGEELKDGGLIIIDGVPRKVTSVVDNSSPGGTVFQKQYFIERLDGTVQEVITLSDMRGSPNPVGFTVRRV